MHAAGSDGEAEDDDGVADIIEVSQSAEDGDSHVCADPLVFQFDELLPVEIEDGSQ